MARWDGPAKPASTIQQLKAAKKRTVAGDKAKVRLAVAVHDVFWPETQSLVGS
jgi:hypothetical protein